MPVLEKENLELRVLNVEEAPTVITVFGSYRQSLYSTVELTKMLNDFPSAGLFKDGQMIGFCYSRAFTRDILEIENIFLKSEWRNKAYGGVLLSAIHDQAVEKGIHSFIVSNSLLYETFEEKRSARSFYLNQGYHSVLSTTQTDVFVKSVAHT